MRVGKTLPLKSRKFGVGFGPWPRWGGGGILLIIEIVRDFVYQSCRNYGSTYVYMYIYIIIYIYLHLHMYVRIPKL